MKKTDPNAADVLNWDYLCQIAEWIEKPRNWKEGSKRFAYLFTSTGDAWKQNIMLTDLLLNATAHQSAQAAEAVIDSLASSFQTDESLLRKFARQCGIKLRKSGEEG